MTMRQLWEWVQEHNAEEATIMVYGGGGWKELPSNSPDYDEHFKEIYL